MKRCSDLTFDRDGLLPAIIQDALSGEVLMLAYMNAESLKRTLASGRTVFWSRSRECLWLKGETSGNIQQVVDIRYDCDGDALVIRVKQQGNACHTGQRSCFYRRLTEDRQDSEPLESDPVRSLPAILDELFEVIQARRKSPHPDSYTSSLLNAGKEKILKKVGEEAAETIIASMSGDAEEIIYEVGDLLYHVLVLLAFHELQPNDVYGELAKRRRPE